MQRIIAGGAALDRTLAVARLVAGVKLDAIGAPRTTIGGGAVNQALATAALAPDRDVLVFALVGDDDGGAAIRRGLAQRGIDMPLAPCRDETTSESYIISETDFEGRGMIARVLGARARELPLEQIRQALDGAEAFQLCAPTVNDQIGELLEAARSQFVPAYFALGGAQIDGLGYESLARQLEPGAELAICNFAEAARLTGTKDVRAQLRALRFAGRVRAAVVTCGADGLQGFDNSGYWSEAACCEPGAAIVDDTGAGDAAAAAIIDALLRGLPLPEALVYGARNGFEACTGYGLARVCSRQQLQSYAGSRRRIAA